MTSGETGIAFDAGRARRVAAARQVLPESVVERFEAGMFRTDKVVDAVVDDFAEMGRGTGWRLLEQALGERRATVAGAPPSLEPLLGPLMEPPAWFDAEQIRWGAAVWWRFMPAVVISLNGALTSGLEFGDLNKPQAMNGRSVQMAARRYEETARWMLAVTEPGAAAPGGAGFDATVRIRLVHAMVRRHLRRGGRWNRAAWGEPIHTSGMAVTNLAFLLLPLATFDLLNIELTGEETEAIRQLWHWVGYLMGVPPELLPSTMELGKQIALAGGLIFAPPDEDSVILIKALRRAGIRAERVFPKPLWPLLGPILRPPVSRLVWGMGDRIVKKSVLTSDTLTYGDLPWEQANNTHFVLAALRPAVAVRERLRLRGSLGSDFQIAHRQRSGLTSALSVVKAEQQSVRPQDVVTAR